MRRGRRRAIGGRSLCFIRRQTGEPRRQIHARDRHYGHDAFTSVATASAQNFFEALFGRLAPSPGPVPDANFTARDRQQLAYPPYRQAWIPPAYRRQVVRYHRQEAPGTVVVDTAARYVYYVLPEGKAIRYGATVGEDGQTWSGVATVGRKEEWPGWTPTASEKRRLGPLPNHVEGGASNQWVRARSTSIQTARTRCIASTARTSRTIGHAISSGCIRLTNEDVIDLYSRVKMGALVVVLGPKQGASYHFGRRPIEPIRYAHSGGHDGGPRLAFPSR